MRFTMIPPKELLKIEQSSLYADYKSLFMDKINQAYRMHALAMSEEDSRTSNAPASSGDGNDGTETLPSQCGHESFRNYTDATEYLVAHEFYIKDFLSAQKMDARVTLEFNAMHRYISSSRWKPEDATPFSSSFLPKGDLPTFTVHIWMDRLSNHPMLKVCIKFNHLMT
jgi:hypothetical protein